VERKAIAIGFPSGSLRESGAIVPSAKEYRRRAEQCLQLAEKATEAYAIQALAELAAEFNKAADELERRSEP
jgi:hypothetical protein